MAIIAGIDEAGLGPLLGPLVVSATVWSVPDELLDVSLWRVLAGAVTARNFGRSAALPVADSKKVYAGDDGLARLERGVLGLLRQARPLPAAVPDLLEALAPGAVAALREVPWYATATAALPRNANGQELTLGANALSAAMARRGVALPAVRCEVVAEAPFNRLLEATRNKAVAHFGIVARLIDWVWTHYASDGPARLVIDRLGGRERYGPELRRCFPDAALRVLDETPRTCAYLLRQDSRQLEVRFSVNGERAALPTAAASMFSKYLRELLMEAFNAWWSARVGALKPTAGYYTDAQRFLRDIAGAIESERIDPRTLIRQR